MNFSTNIIATCVAAIAFICRILYYRGWHIVGLTGGASGKEFTPSAGNPRDMEKPREISGLGRFPGVRNGITLQYSCLENSMSRGVCWATVHGATKSQTCLSNWEHTHTHTGGGRPKVLNGSKNTRYNMIRKIDCVLLQGGTETPSCKLIIIHEEYL